MTKQFIELLQKEEAKIKRIEAFLNDNFLSTPSTLRASLFHKMLNTIVFEKFGIKNVEDITEDMDLSDCFTKDNFIATVNLIKSEYEKKGKFSDFIEEEITDGYFIFKDSNYIKALELLFKLNFNNDGYESVEWWLYEDVEKYIYRTSTDEVIFDLTEPDKLYDYIIIYNTDIPIEEKAKKMITMVDSDPCDDIWKTPFDHTYDCYESALKDTITWIKTKL